VKGQGFVTGIATIERHHHAARRDLRAADAEVGDLVESRVAGDDLFWFSWTEGDIPIALNGDAERPRGILRDNPSPQRSPVSRSAKGIDENISAGRSLAGVLSPGVRIVGRGAG
jgi:hypothetical protein